MNLASKMPGTTAIAMTLKTGSPKCRLQSMASIGKQMPGTNTTGMVHWQEPRLSIEELNFCNKSETWFHLANREIVKCYKRNDVGSKEFGVFSTRSADRPNPIGFHIVTVLEIVIEKKIRIFPMEALNATPVIDIKPFN
ncbi:TrmO family methyltransferase domain-containing protein [Flavitalea sp.]|nr:TrmO family methyltransferase [Flavitalea sp.]